MTKEIIKLMEAIDSNKFNCVFSTNGMTLLTSDEYFNRLNEIHELKQKNRELKEDVKDLSNQKEMMFKNMQLNQLKVCELAKVLDEIRELIDVFPCIHYSSVEKVDGKRLSGKLIPVDDLLQILDKVKE